MTERCAAREEETRNLESLRTAYATNTDTQRIVRELIKEIEAQIQTPTSSTDSEDTDTSASARFQRFKHTNASINEDTTDLKTALTILKKEKRDRDDLDTLSGIVKKIDKNFVGETAVLLKKVEKVVAAEPLIPKTLTQEAKPLTAKQETEKLLLHQKICGQRDVCLRQPEDKHRDKYLVLCVALNVLENKASLADLAQAKKDHPKYNEGIFVHKTAQLVEKTIRLCKSELQQLQQPPKLR